MKQLFLTFLLSAAAASAFASEVYRVTDENGNTFYTNIKPATQGRDTEKVEINQPNISAETPNLPSPPENEPRRTRQGPDNDKENGENTDNSASDRPGPPPRPEAPH